MKIKQAVFIKSSSNYEQCPKPDRPEYAFIGRSNVGKSSLINAMTGFGQLAKTSSKPGKTQVINHFYINNEWYLVDLPGYGYAKVAKTDRQKWHSMTDDYLKKRQNLVCIFVLIDIRIEPQKIDHEFLQYLVANDLPFALVFTKSDKLIAEKVTQNLEDYQAHLLKIWEELPPIFVTSAVAKKGTKELLEQIQEWNKLYQQATAKKKKP